MSMAIGIDLGTYNSAAAFALGRDRTIMVESKHGETLYCKNFPSFVLFDHNGQKQLVGKLARAQGSGNPKLLVWGVKRLVGLSYETAKERGELERFKYDIERGPGGPGGSVLIKVGEERYTPSHILEFILREIKEDAENPRANPSSQGTVEKAVISVPAYFDATRTGPILEAARKAGFPEVATIAEPTAAALEYGLKINRESHILTFDLGAGTLDVTIMLFTNVKGDLVPGELCTSGHEALGGIDMDDMLTSYIVEQYGLSVGERDPRAMAMLREEVEKAKIRLSSRESVPLDLPTERTIDLTRIELETVLGPLIGRCRGPIRVALRQAGLDAPDLDAVLFVGGPTHMPCVRAAVRDELNSLGARPELLKELEELEQKGLPVDPIECVARGASLRAAGIVKPTAVTDPNGYGTTVGPVPGLPNYFYAIILPNSNYPLPPQRKGIIHHNAEALRVPISLVKKLPYDGESGTVYKYYHLGDYNFFLRATGEEPDIDIFMELDSNKNLITTLRHKQTGESVRFDKLNSLRGKEVMLQEHTQPGAGSSGGPGAGPQSGGGGGAASGGGRGARGRTWTKEQLEKAKHVASMVAYDFAERSQDSTVARKKLELLDVAQGLDDPDDASLVMNRIQELLNALHNANEISEREFKGCLDELEKIERAR